MKITGDLKCLACGRVWATAQDDVAARLDSDAVRSLHPEVAVLNGKKLRRCPRCGGTLLLEMTEAEEFETDLLVGS